MIYWVHNGYCYCTFASLWQKQPFSRCHQGLNLWTFYWSFKRRCFCYLCSPLFFMEGCRQTVELRERASHKHWDIAGKPEALSTRVYGLVQRLHLSIPRLSLSSWSIPSSPYLLELHFICSSSLLIFHLSSTPLILFFICPALLNHLLLCPSYLLPSPPLFLYPHCFLCFCPLLNSLFFFSLLVISSALCLISAVTSLLSSPALPCSLFSTHVFPWSFPLYRSLHVQERIFSCPGYVYTSDSLRACAY